MSFTNNTLSALSHTGNSGFAVNGNLSTGEVTYSARPLTINKVANGYAINIGCQIFVFESLANLIYRVEEYYTDPTKVERYFNEKEELPVILPKKK